jgi:DNA-binding Xre family transcriptional regulator
MSIRKQLNDRLAAASVSKRSLAKASNTSLATVRAATNGHVDVRLSTLERMVDALGCQLVLMPRARDVIRPTHVTTHDNTSSLPSM